MTKLFTAIFLMIGGLVAFFVVQSFVGELNTTNWSGVEITLYTIILPASIIFGSLAAIFIRTRGGFGRRPPPEL